MTNSQTPPNAEPKRRLLEVAADQFSRRGYDGVDVKSLTIAADCGETEFYEQFSSKKDLYAELLHSIRDELISRGGQIMAGAGTLEDRLKAAWDVFFRFAEEQPMRVKVLTATPFGVEELQDILNSAQDEATRSLAMLLIAEPSLLASDVSRHVKLTLCMEFIRCGMHGLVRWWIRHPEASRIDLTEAMNAVAWMGLKGMSNQAPRGSEPYGKAWDR